MSQKFKIVGLKHKGASVYLGDDSYGNPTWSRNPERVANWLCDGWRFRFNQFRAQRTSRKKFIDPTDNSEVWLDVPLGGPDVPSPMKHSQARKEFSWLSAIPARVLESPDKVESTEWFSALKRIKTAGGRAPGFKSKAKGSQTFLCWNAKGTNANFFRVSKRSGVVVIKGQNPKAHTKDGSRWELHLKVRTPQSVRPYTSVNVNISKMSLTFTNLPEPVERTQTGSEVGIDRGVVHTLATSNGEFFDIPKEDPTKYKSLQKKLSRQVKGSNRRAKTLASMNRIKTHEVGRRTDWIHKTTTTLVKEHDVVVLEDLKITNMVRKGKHKRGLNRSILASNWGQFQSVLQYKATLAGVKVVLVNPAYTSQECNLCHYTSRENRESQSVFKCVGCGHSSNADTNAARNILDRGTGQSIGLGRGGKIRLPKASAKESASCEASTAGPLTKTKVLGKGQQSNSR